jgi:ABC-type Fe3+ transport system substrate-binding protein
VFEELRGLPNSARIHPFFFTPMQRFDGRAWPLYATIYGLTINAQLVLPSDEPKNWKDVLNPKWKGQIMLEDPGRSGGGSNIFDVSMRTPGYGEEFHRQLAQQDPLVVRSPAEVERALVGGERAVAFPGTIQGPARNPGAPLKWIAPSDGVVIVSTSAALIKDAPAPNAAKVFINWMFTPEFGAHLGEQTQQVSSIPGVRHPMGLSIENLPPLGPGTPDPTGAQEMQERGGRFAVAEPHSSHPLSNEIFDALQGGRHVHRQGVGAGLRAPG